MGEFDLDLTIGAATGDGWAGYLRGPEARDAGGGVGVLPRACASIDDGSCVDSAASPCCIGTVGVDTSGCDGCSNEYYTGTGSARAQGRAFLVGGAARAVADDATRATRTSTPCSSRPWPAGMDLIVVMRTYHLRHSSVRAYWPIPRREDRAGTSAELPASRRPARHTTGTMSMGHVTMGFHMA
jgi:hypothetical protein